MGEVTDSQRRILDFLGIGTHGITSSFDASRLISIRMENPAEAARWTMERARRKLAAMPDLRRDEADPQDSHAVLLLAATHLVKGFLLADGDCRSLLTEYASRSDRPWTGSELEHKLRAAAGTSVPDGYMLKNGGGAVAQKRDFSKEHAAEKRVKVEYSPETLKRFAGEWASRADTTWLANRSAVDPQTCDSRRFLELLYGGGERVLIFTDEFSQGDAVWPDSDNLPSGGPKGVWYLIQPVDGQEHPNPRGKVHPGETEPRPSRRIEECVTSFRYLCIESDSAPSKEWVGALVRLPLRISAIYTSGGRSIHVLVRVDATSAKEWDQISRSMQPGLQTLGADQQVMATKVRLSRLPGCLRGGKLQKLLYVNPEPKPVAIVDTPRSRDVESLIFAESRKVGSMDLAALKAFRDRCDFYAVASERCRRFASEAAVLIAEQEGAARN